MTDSGSRTFPTDRCPLCFGDNRCAMAAAPAAQDEAACAACWCKRIEIPKELLAKVPEPARGRACICLGCCNAAMSQPAEGVTKTVDPGGREAMQLEANGQTVLISHTGAQVLSWQTDSGDVLWTASSPEYVTGKPVRGGVPVVFPWFGDHKSDPSKPAHGFARSIDWQCSVRNARSATFSCVDTPATRKMWDFAFRAELTVTLGDTLQMAMTITNTDEREFSFEQALHTYFAAGDIHEASVHGLANVPFVEHAREPEGEWDASAPIRFRAETDRVFQQVPDVLSLRATTLGRTVTLDTRNSRSTIVWNPWPNKTARLSQMQANDWQSFVCIESANVGENQVTLAPGASHEMTLTLRVATA
jgi:glucose-6-phosphate 1-epimerase